MKSIFAIASCVIIFNGCAHTRPFSFVIQDGLSQQPVKGVSAYWTESWEKKSSRKPFCEQSGFLFSGDTNLIRVTGLKESVENAFRFAATGYEPLTVTFSKNAGSYSVGVYDTRKSAHPLAIFAATNDIITIPLSKQKPKDGTPR